MKTRTQVSNFNRTKVDLNTFLRNTLKDILHSHPDHAFVSKWRLKKLKNCPSAARRRIPCAMKNVRESCFKLATLTATDTSTGRSDQFALD